MAEPRAQNALGHLQVGYYHFLTCMVCLRVGPFTSCVNLPITIFLSIKTVTRVSQS